MTYLNRPITNSIWRLLSPWSSISNFDELRRIQHLSVTTLAGPPPIEPGPGDTLLKAFKKQISK